MALGQGLAGVARVAYETVGMADFQADTARAERVYRDSVEGMSDAAIRLELAQDKLRRSLAKGPAAYREQARAELALRRETDALTRSQQKQERGFSNLRRGILAQASVLLGGAGLVAGMRSAITVASNLEEQTNKTSQVFDDSSGAVLQWGKTTSTSIGLANDKALEFVSTFGLLFRNVGQGAGEAAKFSQALVELAADMASFNNTSMEDALTAIRSGLTGEIEPLRRYGVFLSEARTRTQALTDTQKTSAKELTTGEKVLARYKLLFQDTTRAQGDFARTSDGLANSQRTLSALWREAQGLVGQALAPAFGDAVRGLRDWLSAAENQKTLQRDINTIVGDGVTVIRTLAQGLGLAKNAAAPLVEAVGGLGNAIRIMGAAWLAFKAKAVLGFAGTALASRTTSAKMVADAAVAGRAWDVATRPRVLPVTTVVGGGAVGKGGRLGGLGRGALGMLGLTPGGAIAVGAGAAIYAGIRSGQRDAMSPSTYQRLREAAGRGQVTRQQLAELAPFLNDGQEREIRRLIAVAGARDSGAGASPDARGDARGPGAIAAANRRSRQRARQDARFSFDDVTSGLATSDERLLDAQMTTGTGDDVREWKRRLALVNRGLRELKLTRDQRMQLKQERVSLLGDLARIEAEEDQAAAAIREKAAQERERRQEEAKRKAEERARKAKERMDKIDKRAAAAADARQDLLKGTGGNRQNMRRAALEHVEEMKKGKSEAEKARDLQQQVRSSQFDFLASLNGIMNQFGGNLQAGSDPRLYTELKAQTDVLRALATNARQPGTTHAKNEIDAAFAGAAF